MKYPAHNPALYVANFTFCISPARGRLIQAGKIPNFGDRYVAMFHVVMLSCDGIYVIVPIQDRPSPSTLDPVIGEATGRPGEYHGYSGELWCLRRVA